MKPLKRLDLISKSAIQNLKPCLIKTSQSNINKYILPCTFIFNCMIDFKYQMGSVTINSSNFIRLCLLKQSLGMLYILQNICGINCLRPPLTHIARLVLHTLQLTHDSTVILRTKVSSSFCGKSCPRAFLTVSISAISCRTLC